MTGMQILKSALLGAWLIVGSRMLAVLAMGIREDVEELKRIIREEMDRDEK